MIQTFKFGNKISMEITKKTSYSKIEQFLNKKLQKWKVYHKKQWII